ncbi:MAG: hypothetical protein ISR59_09795 [Anaerolineales bacterium]|uniref:Uncharacterized protein n=1 Tax=Candidatus Desulfolinea nitratireducens TaxID=2841698 RepID=A0A8J6NIR1_9CHLR|nr:hypothetical protein [Candidatus Desulfolinea nitratireducens]MBL6961392.1 hypothetical protein [Anaerolineales bacterium]
MVDENMQVEVTDKNKATQEEREQRIAIFIAIIFGVVILGLMVWAIISLAQAEPTTTAKVRDIFIIFMALISLFIGFAIIILIVQVTSLINLLQNEIKPILDATNETVHTLRGTTTFLSENIAEPVIKLNTRLAGLQRILELIGIKRIK